MNTIPLTQIIIQLLDSADRSSHAFRRLYRIGTEGCQEFHKNVWGEFYSVLLPVSPNGTVSWPCDYLDYSMLGIINNDGEAVPLKHNEQLSTLKQAYLASTNSLQQVPLVPTGLGNAGFENPQGYPWYWLNYIWGEFGYIHLYGLGGGSPCVGEFTIDRPNRCFYVPNGFGYTALMLEYLSDGYSQTGEDYMVNIYAIQALKWWIRWMDKVDLPKKYSQREIDYCKAQYIIYRREAKVSINKARVSEMQTIFRASVKLVAKA